MRTLCLMIALLAQVSVAAQAAVIPFTQQRLNPPSGAVRADGPDLRWLGGIAVDSMHDSFGGLSGIELMSDRRFLAVSDRGWWLAGELVRTPGTGELMEVFRLEMTPLQDRIGDRYRVKLRDVEGLRHGPDGRVLASFERTHRIGWYGYDAKQRLPSREQGQMSLPAWREFERNEGLESIAIRADGLILVLAEAGETADASPGWLIRGRTESCRITYRLHGGLQPVDATFLPDGSLLVLERSLALNGWNLRLRHFTLPEFQEGPDCALTFEAPDWQADMPPTWPLDNYEGLAFDPASPPGTARVFLVSDDNFKPIQRTYLLHVELVGLKLR